MSRNFKNLEKLDPPNLKIIGGLLSTTFSNFDLLWSKMDFFDFLGLFSKSFSLETIDFCEKSFCIAVSRYNIFHMTHMTHTFVKKAASLMKHVFDSITWQFEVCCGWQPCVEQSILCCPSWVTPRPHPSGWPWTAPWTDSHGPCLNIKCMMWSLWTLVYVNVVNPFSDR